KIIFRNPKLKDRNNNQSTTRLEIIKIDSIRDHFVFKTKSKSGNEVIVLAEKDKVDNCLPFKKFIIADSVHQVSAIKSGSRYDLIGFNVSTIDGIKIRDSAELTKIIWNCDSFTDK
ncbi:MAG: hypothetical protein ABI405_10415, partial [Parafilimonas sp.]